MMQEILDRITKLEKVVLVQAELEERKDEELCQRFRRIEMLIEQLQSMTTA